MATKYFTALVESNNHLEIRKVTVEAENGRVTDADTGAELHARGKTDVIGWGKLDGRHYVVESPDLLWSMRVPVDVWDRVVCSAG